MKTHLILLFALLATGQSLRADGVPLPVYSPVKRLGPASKNPAMNYDTRIIIVGEMTMKMGDVGRDRSGRRYRHVCFHLPIRNVSKEELSVGLTVAGFDAKGEMVIQLGERTSYTFLPGAIKSVSSEDDVDESLVDKVVEWRGTELRVK